MLCLLKKVKLYKKLGPETVIKIPHNKYSYQSLPMIIYRLPAPTKVIL